MRDLFNKTCVLFFSFLLFSVAGIHAEENPAGPGVLFINSNPVNASIIMDEGPILQKTPALVRNISSGDHEITIIKESFAPFRQTVTIEEGQITVINGELLFGTFIAGFPGEDNIVLSADDETRLPHYVRIPSGVYSLQKEGRDLLIRPEYPKKTLLTVTSTLFGMAFLTNIVSTGVELCEKGELFFPHSDRLIITESIAAVTALAELALLTDRQTFIKEFRAYKTDPYKLDSEAARLFGEAENRLKTGDIEAALAGFSTVVSSFPDFAGTPEALYKIARLHLISGDTNLAAAELKIIINRFPEPAFYDRACQTLSLLYYNSGDIKKSTETAEKMVFYDPVFEGTKDEIMAIGIEQVIENWARNPEGQME